MSIRITNCIWHAATCRKLQNLIAKLFLCLLLANDWTYLLLIFRGLYFVILITSRDRNFDPNPARPWRVSSSTWQTIAERHQIKTDRLTELLFNDFQLFNLAENYFLLSPSSSSQSKINFCWKSVTSMLVTDVGDQMCWWQLVTDKFKMSLTGSGCW